MNINVETGWKIWACEPGNSVAGYIPKGLHISFNPSWCYYNITMVLMKRLGLKYGRVSQENSVNKTFDCPSPSTQLRTAYYWPIN